MAEENPKKVLTGREVQDAIASGTLKPMDVDTYRWGTGQGSKGTQIYRKKWTRIRPGLYIRLLGEYEVDVEECEPYESCPPGERGWFSRWTPIASGRSLEHDGRSDDPVPTFKEAKADVERWLTDKKVDDAWVQNPQVSRADFREILTQAKKERLAETMGYEDAAEMDEDQQRLQRKHREKVRAERKAKLAERRALRQPNPTPTNTDLMQRLKF